MTVRVGINGFGRIGRNFFRAAKQRGADIDFVAVNDLGSLDDDGPPAASTTRSSASLPYDVKATTTASTSTATPSRCSPERDPKDLPWGDLGVDVVIESTGFFTDRDKAAAHLDAGAPLVIVSAPCHRRRRHVRVRRQRRDFDPQVAQGRLQRRRARRTASCRWSRCSTTRSASRRA